MAGALTTPGAPWAHCEARLGSVNAVAQQCWRCSRAAPRQRRRAQQLQTRAALLDPPPFDPAKLSVEYVAGGRQALGPGRRYTLTHNDVTGSLQLSIGSEYNRRQLDGWYTRMLRDEILAEWQETALPLPFGAHADSNSSGGGGGGGPQLSLHVFCHVSGEELWPAPPRLRSFIFQREMALVLDTISHAEAGALAAAPHLLAARVYVHLRSEDPALDRVVEWGRLGDRATWRTATSSVMRSLLSSVMGTVDEGDSATDGSDGSWSRASFTAASLATWDGGAGGGGEAGLGSGPAGWGGGSWDGGDHPQLEQQQQQQPGAPPPGACSGGGGGGGEQQGAVASAGDSAAACSGGGGMSSAAGGAASLAAQQAVESSSWRGATALTADSRRRGPGADVVPAAVSTRTR